MKKIFLVSIAILMLYSISIRPAYAIDEGQVDAIEKLLNEAVTKSGVPGISVSIVNGDETLYFSSGYSDDEKGLQASETTLYELASVSKAFTAAGILLLKEQGHLSMTDSIQKYLPWLNFNYKGKAVDMEGITLNHFLHHTSGITNRKHMQNIPQGSSEDMLEKTVETLKDAELEFYPGEKYSYGTINYDVLGLVIEKVTGKSYENFMIEDLLQPLGLDNTYLYEEDAQETGQLAQGYRTSFLITRPYKAPVYAGNKPAGYIISSSKDMSRWMQIQMDMVVNIPEQYKTIIARSHEPNRSVPDVDGRFYGAGWEVNKDKSLLEHEGVNPNFSSQVTLFPNEKIGISILSNGANTNKRSLVEGIKEILDGNLDQSYQISATQLSDIILFSITIIFIILAIILFIMGLRREKGTKQIFLLSFIITLGVFILSWIYPRLIGHNWSSLLVWQPYSLLTAFVSLGILSGCIAWYISTKYS